MNLLWNAAKFTQAGGSVSVAVEFQGEVVAIRIRDTGIGISPEMLPRVWDLFTQADRAVDQPAGGLGVELTLARRLVELHGGRLEAHSEGIGKGAEFVVTLDAVPAPSEERLPVAGLEAIQQKPARIVVVEDNRDTAESLAMLLEVLGHSVRTVYDGTAALEAARSFMPDVMVTDIGLPGMDGYTLARLVRQDPELQHIVLAALSGHGREEDKRRAMKAGFDYYLLNLSWSPEFCATHANAPECAQHLRFILHVNIRCFDPDVRRSRSDRLVLIALLF